MKTRPHGFLDPRKCDEEVFDYVTELHEYLWRFVRAVNPGAGGVLGDCLDAALVPPSPLPALTAEQLAEIEARANAATAGILSQPWTREKMYQLARTDVPLLVATVRRLSGELAAAKTALDVRDQHDAEGNALWRQDVARRAERAEADNERLRGLLRIMQAMTDGVTQIGIDGINRMRVLIFDGLNSPELEPKP